jgi:uncharacterized GH25 family protein
MKRFFIYSILAAALFLPAAAFAHGVEVFDETGKPDVHTVRFVYTDGESMLFAKVKVFPPSSPDAAAQESIADRYGYFSFVPFEDGEWRLTAEDGMGHKGEIFVTVAGESTAETAQSAAPAGKLPMPFGITLGLSLILNVFTLWYVAGRRSKRNEAAHAH